MKQTEMKQESKAKSTKIVAIYAGLGKNKQEGHKNFGKKFYKYDLSGPANEIKEFIDHPSNKDYEVKYNRDGGVQFWCNWKDLFGAIGSRYNVYVTYYGTYNIDKAESEDLLDTLEQFEERGMSNASRVFTEHVMATRMGLGLKNTSRIAELASMSNGGDADLGKSE